MKRITIINEHDINNYNIKFECNLLIKSGKKLVICIQLLFDDNIYFCDSTKYGF